MKTSKQVKPISGFLMLFLLFCMTGGIIISSIFEIIPLTILLSIFTFFWLIRIYGSRSQSIDGTYFFW